MNLLAEIPDLDRFSLLLVAAQEGMSRECSARMNAALVLLLANQLSDQALLADCIREARAIAAPDGSGAHAMTDR